MMIPSTDMIQTLSVVNLKRDREDATSVGTQEPRQEYNTLCNVYLKCNTDSFFAIPRTFAFSNPITGDFLTAAPSPPSVIRPHRTTRPLVTPGLGACFQQPTYAMDRVHALPLTARRHLAEHYFPPNVSRGPALCRLYFGRDYTGATPSRFFNTNNFPLDETRYTRLATLFEYLPPAADVARAMGICSSGSITLLPLMRVISSSFWEGMVELVSPSSLSTSIRRV